MCNFWNKKKKKKKKGLSNIRNIILYNWKEKEIQANSYVGLLLHTT